MKILSSPLNISVLLHCYISPERHPKFENVKDVMEDLAKAGVLVLESEDIYRTTPLGTAWVRLLCTTQIPTPAFVDGQGKVITL